MFEPTPYSATTSPAMNGGASSKRSKPSQPPLFVPAGHAFFRLLCHASRIGGVIGKSGSIIKHLQQETSAKIRVEEPPPGSDDRVITVIASGSVSRTLSLNASNEDREEGNGEEFEVSAAQEALVRVFERILNVAAETDGGNFAVGGIVSCRLLADTSRVGSVIGKGGKVVEKIRRDTGCKIRILGPDKLPSCALPSDEMVEIEGDILAIKRALIAVSRRLQDCPPFDKTRMGLGRPFDAVPQENLPDMRMDLPPPPMLTSSVNHAFGGHHVSLDADMAPSMDFGTSQQEVVFKILCSSDRVGGVIGKGGTIVRSIQSETGASISVGAPVSECDERLITITAMESLDSRHSPAQNAVVRVFSRSIEAGFEKGFDSPSNGALVSARLVIPSNQVGCLLGKGGSIISDMRKITSATIKIIGGPKCASENDQVVQMTGAFVNVQDALYNVTGRLRNNLLPSRMMNGLGTRGSSSVMTGISPYGRESDPPSLGFHSSVAPSHSIDQHSTLTQSMDHLGLSDNIDRPPSPGLWPSQTVAGVNSRSGQDVGRGLTSIKGGVELGSGSRSAIVTNTIVEIVVPQNVIGSIYGENGSNLTRLRQISGAKVVVHEPRSGTSDHIVIISGTPDETQTAQSVLQAFILGGES